MTKHRSDKSGAERRGGRTGRDGKTGRFLTSIPDRPFRGTVRVPPEARAVGRHGDAKRVPTVRPDEVAWPSGEGREIGTISGSIGELLEVLRGQPGRDAVHEAVAYGEDGTETAIILGPPSRPLASLVADETQAPGVVGVVADIGADPAAVAKAVEERLGCGFEVRRPAV